MAWAVTQHVVATNSGSGNAQAATYTTNLTAGSLLVCCGIVAAGAGIPTASVSDTAGNVWTQLLTATNGGVARVVLFTAPLILGAGTKPTVTLTSSQAQSGVALSILEVTGIQNVIDVSHTSTAAVGSTATSGATGATTGANEFVVGVYGDDGLSDTVTDGTGFSDGGNNSPNSIETISVEYEDSGAIGTTPAATWTLSASETYAALVGVFPLGAIALPSHVYIPRGMPLGV